MAIKKFYRRKRRFHSKKITKASIKKTVKAVIASKNEEKYFDLKFSLTSTDVYNPSITQLSGIAQGVSDSQRVGDSVKPTSLDIRGNIYASVNGALGQTIRIIVFQWRPSLGSYAPSLSAILNNGSTTDGYQPFYQLNRDTRSQYKILADRTYMLLGSTYASGQQTSLAGKYVHLKMKLKQPKIQWQAASTTNQMNGLYMVILSDTGVTEMSSNFVSRLMYYDT